MSAAQEFVWTYHGMLLVKNAERTTRYVLASDAEAREARLHEHLAKDAEVIAGLVGERTRLRELLIEARNTLNETSGAESHSPLCERIDVALAAPAQREG